MLVAEVGYSVRSREVQRRPFRSYELDSQPVPVGKTLQRTQQGRLDAPVSDSDAHPWPSQRENTPMDVLCKLVLWAYPDNLKQYGPLQQGFVPASIFQCRPSWEALG
ncbi:hypothetical protein PGTUg99_001159 [Puccinia graminis f. sp. tritici]|uniref:Uncharacterized protein n=1 Tax=Puccinia graminis f. sp. tritici TaxID=56615 RepID=A0A5B0SGW5_PUCGR|nr:hypothetical protein PGTUg99_017704 [Puccinia graminis f. sp. tritici]KAA1136775.1 hypothetical protein PGTUg99_001159 [Puccinia graminis f. sp. tritici]